MKLIRTAKILNLNSILIFKNFVSASKKFLWSFPSTKS